MKTPTDLLAFIQAGGRPVVTFAAGITALGGYAQAGMQARALTGRLSPVGPVTLQFDFEEFDAHNLPLERTDYTLNPSGPPLSARQAGYYRATKEFFFNPTDPLEEYLSVERDAVVDLFNEFETTARKQAGSEPLTYLKWLEATLLASRASVNRAMSQCLYGCDCSTNDPAYASEGGLRRSS